MEPIVQYDIVLVNLDPTIGSEMKKTRPCVILSPDEMNRHLQTIVVAPMTSHSKPYPTRVEVKHKLTKGWIAIDQIRTIDRRRIVKRFESLSEKEIEHVKNVLRETFVD
ncbi:MAG TPA: type II toxin-antitoxin system PemK/MazF family toxin [Chitinophagales bacterium]|jgi:mRNA interferase MazF|nr:type II toxin-antitoxin system PemK/MazF family toxin [Chitinophagales bacterium]